MSALETTSPKPLWMVYDRSGDSYPVALAAGVDWDAAREYCAWRLLPGPWETIRCSSAETAQRIADWLNSQTEDSV